MLTYLMALMVQGARDGTKVPMLSSNCIKPGQDQEWYKPGMSTKSSLEAWNLELCAG